MESFKLYKKGISLITLVITIIVVIILAAVVILSLQKSNPISVANEAVFKSDVGSFESELSMYHTNNYSKLSGQYEEDKLQADNTKVEYTGAGRIETQSKTIKDIITGLDSKKYENQFEIINGKLAYKGTDVAKQQWSLDTGILVDNDKTNVTIATSSILPIKQTGSIEYIIDVYSNIGIKDIGNITSSIKVIDKDSNEVTATVAVGQIKSLTNEKQISVTVQGIGLSDGEYKVKLLAGAVENNANLKNVDIISINSFIVDSTAPENPSIVSSPTIWTNQDVTATITYPTDSIKNEYSYDSTNWQTYTAVLTISSNCTIYARATDAAGNISAQSTLSITNIDRKNPTVSFSPNGQNNIQKAETAVIVTDNSNEFSNLQYIWSTSTTEPTDGWTTFENNAKLSKDTVTASYYLWIKATDAAGNITTIRSEAFGIDNTVPEAPSIVPNTANWTNQNITVIITYPADSIKNEYSYNSTNWSNYTTALTISDNCTISAKATDAAGNISSTSTLSITNIDKSAPAAPSVNLNGYTSGSWTTANVTVGLSSSDSQSGIQKYQYSYDGTNWTDIASSYTISYDYNYYITYRSIDNAGNASSAAVTNIIRVDKTGPTASGYEIKNVSSTGYDVYIYGVTDNYSGVNRVQFPTWTDYNGQDDIQANWPTNSVATGQNLGNGTWYYRVNSSAHNNEYGKYETHIYFYDNLGNYNMFATSGATITDPSIVATFYLTNTYFNGSTSYSQSGSVSNNYTIEFDAQPTSTISSVSQGTMNTFYPSTQVHKFILMDSWGGGVPNAGLGLSLGTNGVNIIAHSDGYYHFLLTYYVDLSSWHHYKLVVQNRVPRLYIDGTCVKNGDTPYSSYTNIYTVFSLGAGAYSGTYDVSYRGYANNFIFYNTVR